jgi:hypothetical protein
MSNPVITVVRDPKHVLGKQFSIAPNGSVVKKSAVRLSFGFAVMHRVDDHDSLARLLTEVGEDPHAAIINASFDGVEVGERFVIMSEREMENRLRISKTDRDKQKGVHDFVYKSTRYKALGRFKENVTPSCWQFLDRDVDEYTPESFSTLSFESWLEAVCTILPECAGITYAKSSSTSSRVLRDGVPVGRGNGHLWVKIDTPDAVERVRTAVIIRAAEADMTWLKPRFSRTEPGKVVGHSLATIIDPSVWTPGRRVHWQTNLQRRSDSDSSSRNG